MSERIQKLRDIRDVRFRGILECDEETQERVRNWRNREEIRKYMYNDHIIGVEEHRHWLERLKQREDLVVWVIYYRNDPVGTINLQKIDPLNKTTEWGFYIAEESGRGKGVGTMALFRLVEHVFEEMDFHKLNTTVLGNNPGALKLYFKLRFREEGNLRKQILRENQYIDVILLGMLKEEWMQEKQKIAEEIGL